MIRLRVVRAAQQRPPALGADDSGVATWRDADGTVFAFAALNGDDHRIDVPGVAQFAFSSTQPEVVAWPSDGSRDEHLYDHYYRAVLPLAIQARGPQVLHASAVERHHSVLALAAPKENGKSTLAFGLGRRGYRLWADDALAFVPGPDGVATLALPFDLRLREAPAKLFGQAKRVPVTRSRSSDGAPFELERARLAAVVVLDRLPARAASPSFHLDRLRGAAALLAVLPNAYCFESEDQARLRRMTDQYLALVARVPLYALRYQSGLEHVPKILDQLESILDTHAALRA